MKILSIKERILEERKEREALRAKTEKTDALLTYTAMMADVELPEEVNENEQIR